MSRPRKKLAPPLPAQTSGRQRVTGSLSPFIGESVDASLKVIREASSGKPAGSDSRTLDHCHDVCFQGLELIRPTSRQLSVGDGHVAIQICERQYETRCKTEELLRRLSVRLLSSCDAATIQRAGLAAQRVGPKLARQLCSTQRPLGKTCCFDGCLRRGFVPLAVFNVFDVVKSLRVLSRRTPGFERLRGLPHCTLQFRESAKIVVGVYELRERVLEPAQTAKPCFARLAARLPLAIFKAMRGCNS